MVSAVGVDSPQAAAMVTAHRPSTDVRVPQLAVMVPINVPTLNMEATQAKGIVVESRIPSAVRATQAIAMVVCDGRVAQPRIRAFTFSLDGHDFYGLRLGDQETLIYDNQTKQWVPWDSLGLPIWRVNCAINWVGAKKIGYSYGNTNVIAGDDTWGLLYFLDPKQAFDDYPDEMAPPEAQQVPFVRVAMAQTLVNGRDFVPCYVIFLSGDNYGLTAEFVPYVKLETSDNQGATWQDHGAITLQPDTYDQDYRWTSLGQIQSPGRLFRVTDTGIPTRIDGLEMNDD